MSFKKNLLTIFLINIVLFGNSQNIPECDVLKLAYSDIVGVKYKNVLIANETKSIKVDDAKVFLYKNKRHLKKSELDYARNDTANFRVICFNDTSLFQEQEIYEYLKVNQTSDLGIDSTIIAYIDQAQEQILLIKDDQEKYRRLNELTQSEQFKKYSQSSDYLSPRGIFFSKPLHSKKRFIYVKVTVAKSPRDSFSYVCVYKSSKNGALRLVKKIPV